MIGTWLYRRDNTCTARRSSAPVIFRRTRTSSIAFSNWRRCNVPATSLSRFLSACLIRFPSTTRCCRFGRWRKMALFRADMLLFSRWSLVVLLYISEKKAASLNTFRKQLSRISWSIATSVFNHMLRSLLPGNTDFSNINFMPMFEPHWSWIKSLAKLFFTFMFIYYNCKNGTLKMFSMKTRVTSPGSSCSGMRRHLIVSQ